MANLDTRGRDLNRADFHAIDIVLDDPSRFDELSTLQREYMQNVARAVPAYANLDGYTDSEILSGITRSDEFAPFHAPERACPDAVRAEQCGYADCPVCY